MQWSQLLKDARERKGWTRPYTADKIGIPARRYESWERGDTLPPKSKDARQAIVSALSCRGILSAHLLKKAVLEDLATRWELI